MISNLMSLLGRSRGWRVYINGIEIDKIEPRLPFLDLDDWLTPFFKYAFEERKDWGTELYIHTKEDPRKNEDTLMIGVWFGPVPEEAKKQGYWTTLTYNGKKD